MSILALRAAVMVAALLPVLAASQPLTLQHALELAGRRSEAAAAARAGATGATETARAAGRLPDPMFRIGIENLPVTGPDRFNPSADFMTMKRVGISQEWLFRDKRAAREAAALASVERESVQARSVEADTRLQTALAFLDAWFAQAALDIAERGERNLREELEVARARMSAGPGSATETLALTTARGLAEDAADEARQQHAAAMTELRRWVGDEVTELSSPGSLEPPSEAQYLASHPTLVALGRDIEVNRRVAEATASERTSNWTWEVAYSQRTGFSDMVSVGVSIPLQVAPAQRQDRDIAARLALVDKARSELEEATREATAEFRRLSGDTARLQQRIERLRTGVLPPARQRAVVSLTAYRSNQMPLASFFEARNAEVDAHRKLLSLERELARTQARLAFKPFANGVER
jgi:outer membrane protein TolC